MSRRYVWPIVIAFALSACSDSTGPIDDDDGPLPPNLTLRLEPFLTGAGLSSPIFLAQPLDDGRIFIVMQSGRIEIAENGVLQTTSFLDIRSRVWSGGERGMFSVAFHPQYATNRYFYVCFTELTSGDIRVERFTTSATNPEAADPTTSKLIIEIPHPTYENHNGGLVTFGPDGMLYVGLGDGGSPSDAAGNSQNRNALLGSLLRIDVDTGDPYAIPANNPYAIGGGRGEVWAKGLRNPWRFSIDAPTGVLHIADVGQNAREEVNAQLYTTAGLNYGWPIMEGFSCYPPGTTGCTQTGLTLPALDYARAAGCSVTGGYVYRGTAIDGLQGHYLYSDYCGGWLRSFRYSGGAVVDEKDWAITPVIDRPRSFGVDFDGELYILGVTTIYKIVVGAVAL